MDLFVSFTWYKRPVFPCSNQELYGKIPSDGLCQYVNRVVLTSARLHKATLHFPSLASLARFQASGVVRFPLILIFKNAIGMADSQLVAEHDYLFLMHYRPESHPNSHIHTHMSNATWPTPKTSSKLSWWGFHVFAIMLISVLLEVDDL